MTEFDKVKAEVLSRLNNANIGDVRRSIIENKIAEYEQSYQSANSEELKTVLRLNFKEEIETIINYSGIKLDVLSKIEAFNKEYNNGFYGDDVDFLVYWVCDKPNVITIFSDDTKTIKADFMTLLKLTAQYRADFISKACLTKGGLFIAERKAKIQRDTKQTPKEAKEAIIKRFERCRHDLLVAGAVTEKSDTLLRMMFDFIKNPHDYIPDIPKVNANVDDIRAFLRRLTITADDINSFIARFKRPE